MPQCSHYFIRQNRVIRRRIEHKISLWALHFRHQTCRWDGTHSLTRLYTVRFGRETGTCRWDNTHSLTQLCHLTMLPSCRSLQIAWVTLFHKIFKKTFHCTRKNDARIVHEFRHQSSHHSSRQFNGKRMGFYF